MTIAAWTWMIYLATHNNVARAGEDSVAQMCQAQLSQDVRVLVQQSTPDRTVRHVIGDGSEPVADLGQVDSGEPQTLIDFITWGHSTAPARRYGLILWSHGDGWEPREMARQAQKKPAQKPVTENELVERGPADEGRQIFFSTTMRELLSKPTPPERAIAFDNGSGHSLDTIELGQVLEQATHILGQPLDLLGMNACQMSNVEVIYQMRNYVQLYVASPEDMPVQSWPYDDILTRLAANPDMATDALGKLIVERYCAFYQNSPLPWGQGQFPAGATLTAIQADRITPLSDAVRSLATVLESNVARQLRVIWDAHRGSHAFKFHLYDLASFCRLLSTHPDAAPETVQAASDVLTTLEDPAFRLAYCYTSPAYANTGGLTTYLMFPEPGNEMSPYYAETDYAGVTNWGTFLTGYHGAVPR